MEYLKKLYGKTKIDSNDSEEIKKEYKIELEYYQTRSKISDKPYGVEIVKKRITNDKIKIENKIINNICYTEQDSSNLLDILVLNKVSPITVEDIIQDLLQVQMKTI